MATYVAVFALVLAYVALVAAYCALRALARLRRASRVLSRGDGGESLVEATNRHAERTNLALEELAALRGQLAAARTEAQQRAEAGTVADAGALRNIALVRYDAFAGGSGRLSFSLALLDDSGDGVAISSIAGQSDTRMYAKGVAAGKAPTGERELSPEEQQAVRAALRTRSGGPARKAS
jgi:hypothetical protein